MSKLRKAILIIGILVVAVAASLGTALALYATGSMKTDPIELVYAIAPEEKVYDGTPLKAETYALTSGKLASGHRAHLELTGSQTDVGTSMSDATVKIYDENGFNVTGDYSIKVVGASLTVTHKTISVELPSQTVVYNGSKVLFNEYRIADDSDGELCSGHKIYGSTDAELLNVGDALPEDLTPLIFDVAGRDVTANYNIVDFKYDGIEIVRRHISVRPVSGEKVYDGMEMLADKIEFVEGSLVEGQTAEFLINEGYLNKLTDVGDVETQVTSLKIYDFINGEEVEVTENYEIDTFETGYLKVTPRPLTITAKSASFVYNGEEQSLFDDDEALKVEGLADGEELLGVTYSGALTDVGTTENYIIGITLRGREENYDKHFVSGTIEITPYELTFETFSAEKFYDGDPLFDARSDYELANENHRILINGGDGVPAEPAADVLPSVTNVGQIANAYTVTVFDNVNNNCTQNYNITYDYGTLTVKRLNVKVTLESAENSREKVNYDSREHTPTLGSGEDNSKYFSVVPLLQEGEEVAKCDLKYTDFEVVAESRSMRVAGEYYYTVKFKDRTYEDRKLYSNYELFVPESGVLEITPLPVTVTLKAFTDDKAFVYSGKAITFGADEAIDKITVTAGTTLPAGLSLDDILTAEDFAVVAANDIINAGTDYNYSVKIADVSFAKNFSVTLSDGTKTVSGVKITVKPMPITVTLADVERTYSGEEQTVTVDETVVKIAKTDAKEDEDDETGLTKSDLVIAYDSDEERIDVTNYSFTVAAVKKKAGNYELSFKSSNNAEREYAILKINTFKVEVTTDTPDLTYNSGKQSSGLFTHGELANAKHTALRFTPDSSLPYVINVGENTENRFAVRIYDESNTNVTDNYDIKYNYGTLSVKKCPVTITTDSKSKPYDGDALTAPSADADSLFTGHKLSLPAVTPSQTEVGTKTNEFYCDIVDGDGISVIDNYLVTNNPGTLEVTKNVITLKTEGDVKTYDGTPLYKTDVTITDTNQAKKFKAQLPVGAQPFSITEVGEAVNTFDCAIYLKESNADVTDNFEIVFSDECGKLKIEPLAITFLLHDFAGELEYDGKPKTLEVCDAILGITGGRKTYGFVTEKTGSGVEFTEDDFEIVYSSLMLDAGNYSYSVKFTDENFAKNFTVNKQTTPTVRVKKKPVEILLKSYTGEDAVTFAGVKYVLETENAITHIFDGDGIDLLGDLLDISDFNVVYKTELLNAGRHEYTVAFVDDVFAKNFFFSEPKGYVDINKFDVKISLGNFSADYSGEEFVFPEDAVKVITEDSATTEEKALAALITSADFTFEAENGAAIIDAGTYIYGANLSNESKAQNYNVTIETENGRTATVTIKKAKVTVKLNPQELTFDGNERQIDPAKALEIEGTKLSADDFTFNITQNGAPATLKKSGEYEYEAIVKAPKNGNFEITVTEDSSNKITVKKCTVTVTLNNLAKTYDGKEYEIPPRTAIYSVDGGLFGVYDFEVGYVEEGEHVNAGEYHLKAELLAKHNDIKDDVILVTENGLITITKRAVTVKTPSKTFVFNGAEQSATDKYELLGAVEGHYADAITDTIVKVIDITDEPVTNDTQYAIYYLKGGTEEINVTGNYEISYIYGELQVKPIDVTVTLASNIKKSYLGVELSLEADDVIDEIKCDAFISGEDFEVVFYETVLNAGKYPFELKIKEDSNPEVYNLKVEGQKILTVDKLGLTVELESYVGADAREYTGKVQKLTKDDITVGDNPDELTAEDFRFDYYEDMKDVGTYEYGVKFADELTALNYDLHFEKGNYQIVPAKVIVTLKDYEKIYEGTAYAVDVFDAIESIKDESGEDSGLLSRSDFEVKYLQELRLANGIVKPIEEGEVYDGKRVEIDGVEYKVITDDSYTYSVELTKKTESGNFEITVEGGSFVIRKRKLTFTLSTFYISKIDFDEGFGGDYEAYGFEVSANVGLSSTTSLGKGDELHINSALAQGEGNGFIALYLLEDFTLTNADCYEFTNVNGKSAVYAKLEVFDV